MNVLLSVKKYGEFMMLKETRRTKMTRLLFHTALIELMQEKSFSRITIRDICTKAELNRTTFYRHYNDQGDLIAEIEDELIQKTVEYMKNVSREEGTIAQIEIFLDFVKENSRVFKVLFSGYDSSGRMRTYMENVTASIRPNLPDYGTKQEEKYILNFIMNGTFNVIETWIDSSFDLPAARVAQLIYTMCDGISLSFNETKLS